MNLLSVCLFMYLALKVVFQLNPIIIASFVLCWSSFFIDALAYGEAHFLVGLNYVLTMENVVCNGDEGTVFNCSWNKPQPDAAKYNENIGVKCFNESGTFCLVKRTDT